MWGNEAMSLHPCEEQEDDDNPMSLSAQSYPCEACRYPSHAGSADDILLR